MEDMVWVVEGANKRRFQLLDGRMRALYGHSTPQHLRKERAVSPERLFHGTSPATAEKILDEGLKPMARHYVHLSVDVDTAHEVGRRKAREPVILEVAASAAHAAGVAFYVGNEKVWLADTVPAEFILHTTSSLGAR